MIYGVYVLSAVNDFRLCFIFWSGFRENKLVIKGAFDFSLRQYLRFFSW